MQTAVDHHLRRIDFAVATHLGITLLPGGVVRIGKRVLPAKIIPVVDRQADRHQRRIGGKFADQLVRGRTGRTALAGEQFDHRARIGVGDCRWNRHGCADGHYIGEATRYHCDLHAPSDSVSLALHGRRLAHWISQPGLVPSRIINRSFKRHSLQGEGRISDHAATRCRST